MPMRIVLAVTLAFAALWFAALRPKAPAEPAPAAPVAAATPTPAAAAAAAPAPPTPTPNVRPATPQGGATDARRPDAGRPEVRAVLRDIERRKTVVMLFAGRGADDRSVRRAVARADRHDGAVTVHVAPIRRLAAYEPVVRGLPVQHAPTVLVVARDKTAQAISGLTVTREIDEAVRRALKRR